MMHVSVWFEFFGDLFLCQNSWYMREKCDNKEWDLNWEHCSLLRFWDKKMNDIKEVDVMEFTM